MPAYVLRVNGEHVEVIEEADAPLLHVLRNVLGLRAAKFGCGQGLCGACVAWVDGSPLTTCDLLLEHAVDREITTLEGLGGDGRAHPIQQAFLEHQAGQCGYCLAGILMTGAAHVRDHPDTDRAAAATALDKHLCRCGSHQRMLDAILDAAGARPS
ncbi:MAG: 2Fe-2S iron-sulfur cluster-binding protein [Actinomycetota bacterium]|nr:2Fe-2S iron-sulfur cluster-binding protein [Actinomycetota bacterium]